MISIETARELKAAGLVWQTATHDFFSVPETGLDDRVFVLTDIVAYTELVQGWPVVAFHGTAEWALDYIYTSEVVWIPTEEQLRNEITRLLQPGPDPFMTLELTTDGSVCTINKESGQMKFTAETVAEAYAATLLHLLEIQDDGNRV